MLSPISFISDDAISNAYVDIGASFKIAEDAQLSALKGALEKHGEAAYFAIIKGVKRAALDVAGAIQPNPLLSKGQHAKYNAMLSTFNCLLADDVEILGSSIAKNSDGRTILDLLVMEAAFLERSDRRAQENRDIFDAFFSLLKVALEKSPRSLNQVHNPRGHPHSILDDIVYDASHNPEVFNLLVAHGAKLAHPSLSGSGSQHRWDVAGMAGYVLFSVPRFLLSSALLAPMCVLSQSARDRVVNNFKDMANAFKLLVLPFLAMSVKQTQTGGIIPPLKESKNVVVDDSKSGVEIAQVDSPGAVVFRDMRARGNTGGEASSSQKNKDLTSEQPSNNKLK